MKYPIYRVRNNIYHYRAALRRVVLRKVFGMNIGDNTRISSKARLDFVNPKGLHVGENTNITLDVIILTHDLSRNRRFNTYIGSNCFIGAGSIILPGVRIGDHCIIGAGSVVTKDIPDRSVAAGNPARILQSDIMTLEYGVLVESP